MMTRQIRQLRFAGFLPTIGGRGEIKQQGIRAHSSVCDPRDTAELWAESARARDGRFHKTEEPSPCLEEKDCIQLLFML